MAGQARALSGAISRMDALRRFADDILASLPDATLVTDAEGIVIQANAAGEALLMPGQSQGQTWTFSEAAAQAVASSQ